MSVVSPTMSSEVEAKINLFDALENSPKVSTIICEKWDMYKGLTRVED